MHVPLVIAQPPSCSSVREVYRASLREMDAFVGRLKEEIDSSQEENTLLWFTGEAIKPLALMADQLDNRDSPRQKKRSSQMASAFFFLKLWGSIS